jgi:ABC-type Fe3+-hydroxamate transport system substrate-binding protein
MRVVSLVPSATEILALLMQEAGPSCPVELVGRSHECDYPPSLAHVPILTGQVIQPGTPAEIDAQVRAQLGAQLGSASSLYTLDTQRLAELKPDLIITQDLCSVCSIDLNSVRSVAAGLNPTPEILSLNPDTVEAMLDDIHRVGRAVGLQTVATSVVVALRERLHTAQEFVNPFDAAVAVAFLEWTDPIFVGGHWTPQLIERAGGSHPLNPTQAGDESGAAMGPQMAYRKAGKSVRVPREIMAATNPDRVILCPCGMGLEATRGCFAQLMEQQWFRALRAVRSGGVALVDGNQYFNRPGPRLVDGLEWLVGWLQGRPEVIPKGFVWESVKG